MIKEIRPIVVIYPPIVKAAPALSLLADAIIMIIPMAMTKKDIRDISLRRFAVSPIFRSVPRLVLP